MQIEFEKLPIGMCFNTDYVKIHPICQFNAVKGIVLVTIDDAMMVEPNKDQMLSWALDGFKKDERVQILAALKM